MNKYRFGLYVEVEMEGHSVDDALEQVKKVPQLNAGQVLLVPRERGLPGTQGKVVKSRFLTLVRAEEEQHDTEMLMRRWNPE